MSETLVDISTLTSDAKFPDSSNSFDIDRKTVGAQIVSSVGRLPLLLQASTPVRSQLSTLISDTEATKVGDWVDTCLHLSGGAVSEKDGKVFTTSQNYQSKLLKTQASLDRTGSGAAAEQQETATGMPQKGVSPAPDAKRLQTTPQLTLTKAKDKSTEEEEDDEDDELSGTTSGGEEENTEAPAKTAAERLAEKRRMKRFRLTHSQTRFLMNEFSRQPNPDAAHRERLSNEIPGLSPRQVQVWFQNRRAKMKRLTGEDQERVVRSRTLPAGFDFSQDMLGEQSTVPSTLGQTGGPSEIQSHGARGRSPQSVSYVDRRQVPPINMASVFRNPSYAMSAAGGSSNPSPVSSINENTAYSGNQSPVYLTSRTASPFQPSGSFPRQVNPSGLNAVPQTHGMSMRARASSLASLSPTSVQTFAQFGYMSSQSSFEGLQESYQMYESQSQPRAPAPSGYEPQLGDLAQLHLNPMTSSTAPVIQEHGMHPQARRYSASMAGQSQAAPHFEAEHSSQWFVQQPGQETSLPGFHVQDDLRRPREAIQSTQQAYQGGMLPPNMTPPGYYNQAGVPEQVHSQYLSRPSAASTNTFQSQESQPSLQPMAPSPNLSDGDYSSEAQSYTQSPGYPNYYSSPQQ